MNFDYFHRTCVDLVDAASEGRLPTVYARDSEAEEVLSLLRAGRSVLLCGPPGVGKTAVINRAAALLAQTRGRDSLRIFSVTTAQIVATHQGYIGQWQAQLGQILDGVRAVEGVLFYTDIWLALGGGRTTTSEDNIWDAIAPLLERGELTLLAECQSEVLRHLERRAPGMVDRFTRVDVRPLSEAQTQEVLRSHAARLAKDAPPGERWAEDVVNRLRELTDRFQPYRAQPGKGIALIDRVAHYRKEKLRRGEDEPISTALVERVFSVYSGLPLFVFSDQVPLQRAQASRFFQDHIVGQEQAIAPLVEAIALYKAGLNDPRRPIASFLFVGPTGVGKTELARTLAKFLFGAAERLLRLDMSEYRDFHGYQLLVGDPARPDERALLCDPIREQPFQVVLLDEFEKGHPNIADLLLQVLDAGRLTTPRGVVIDFTSTILILTSNLGSDLRRGQIGLRPNHHEDERSGMIDSALRDVLRPEFLNRLDRVVQFRALSEEDLRLVARRELQQISERRGIRGRRVTLEVDDAVIDKIIAEEVDRKQGARGLRRALERRVAVPVALALVERPAPLRPASVAVTAAEGSAAGEPSSSSDVPPERLRVRLDALKGVAVELYGEDERGRPRRPSAGHATVRLEGDDSKLRMTPQQAQGRVTLLRHKLDALTTAYGLPLRKQELEQMAQEHARPGFWADAPVAAREFARYNRVSFQVRRLERLHERLEELQKKSAGLKDGGGGGKRRAPIIDSIAELTTQVEEADLELRCLGVDGDFDEADALIRLRPELAEGAAHGHGAEELAAARQLWEMYAGWAHKGPRRAELLYLPVAGGLETPLLLGVISGPLAFGYLRRETGQHRFRLRRGGSDGPGLAVLVRVQVYPVQLEGDAALAPREVLSQAYALKQTIEESGGPRRIRSAVLAHTADGQPLGLQNERDLAENRALARRLVAAIDAFPSGGRPATDDPLVRSYEFAAQPLIKDNATGFSSGRTRDIMSGDLDELLRLRVQQIPTAAPEGSAPGAGALPGPFPS